MAQRTSIARIAAPLAAVLALGAVACSQEDVNQAGEDVEAAAEEVAEATGEATEAVGQAAEDVVDAIRTPAPADARVFFANLDDGAVVQSPLTIEFGSENIAVTAAGDQTAGTGHHHLLIDATLDDLDMGQPIPNDVNHMHFGQAQTEATIELTPGEHTLQLLMGDWTHIPHEPVVASEVITVTVE